MRVREAYELVTLVDALSFSYFIFLVVATLGIAGLDILFIVEDGATLIGSYSFGEDILRVLEYSVYSFYLYSIAGNSFGNGD